MTKENQKIYDVLQCVFDRLMDNLWTYEDASELLESVMFETLTCQERQEIMDEWKEKRDCVRQEAIDFQHEQMGKDNWDLDYEYEKTAYFEKQAPRYNLTEEFIENGIISAEDEA